LRKISIFLGILVIAAIILTLPRVFQAETPDVSAQDVQTATVQRTTLNTTIESSGTVAPEQTANLSFGANGTVSEVDAKVGDTVKAGAVLAKLDTGDLEYQISLQEQSLLVQQTSYDQLVAPPTDAQIAQAKASLLSAQSQLQSAKNAQATAPNQITLNCSNVDTTRSKLDTAQQAYNQYLDDGYQWDANFVPDPDSDAGAALSSAQNAYVTAKAQCDNTTPLSDFDLKDQVAQAAVDQEQANLDSLMAGPTKEDVDAAQAKLKQAQLQLDNARKSLDDAVLSAPFDGVVSAVNLMAGQPAPSGSAAVTLLDISKFHVDVAIDEQDIPQVSVGQKATVALAALPDTPVDGTVSNIPPAGTNSSSVVTYTVRIDLGSIAQLPVRVGMTTDVQIVTATEANVLVVPTQAVQRSGVNEFVQLLNADRTTTNVPVKTGTTSAGVTVIQGDISEGALVVVPQTTGTQTQFGGGGFGLPLGGLRGG
jgi:HlyD family secretion protein